MDPLSDLIDPDITPQPRPAKGNKALPEDKDDRQSKHDILVEDAMLPGMDDILEVCGIELEPMTLTTMTWLRKSGSAFITGKAPEDEEDIIRQMGIFIVAHDKRLSRKERSALFKATDDSLDDRIEYIMHHVRIADAAKLFATLMGYVKSEMATLVTPIKDKDAPSLPGNT